MSTGKLSPVMAARFKQRDFDKRRDVIGFSSEPPIIEKYRAVVRVKVSLRDGDFLDELEALGLIPTVQCPVVPRVRRSRK